MAIGTLVTPGPRFAGRPVWLASRPGLVDGREELLAELDARLSGGDEAGPRVVALWGLAGAGKTSVAVEYAYRHLPRTEAGVCWQLAAEDPVVLAAGFGELAAQLGVRELADVRNPVASVHGALAASPDVWLLLFDNAPDLEAVEGFLPPDGPGRVLITSQSSLWPPGWGLEVPVLDPDEAAALLVHRTSDPDRQAALDLAGELGGLPLALEQAAAYILATAGSLAGYLALFRQRDGLLDRGEPAGYSKTVATTWTLAFERLQKAEPRAVALLRLVAGCAPDAIPVRLLLQPRRPGLAKSLPRRVARVMAALLDDPLASGDAIAALRRYSLISPRVDGSVSVHRLVQAVTRDQMPADLAEKWRQATAAVIDAALPGDPNLPENWPVYAQLLPHAKAALAASPVLRRCGRVTFL